MFCPQCKAEYRQGFTVCSDCNLPLVPLLSQETAEPEADEPALGDLYSPNSETELALLKSILEAEGIYYFVRNELFGSMEIGPQVELFNKKTIMVKSDDYERALELVTTFLSAPAQEKTAPRAEYRLIDKIRMAFEVLLFGWLMPGGKRTPKNKKKIDEEAGKKED